MIRHSLPRRGAMIDGASAGMQACVACKTLAMRTGSMGSCLYAGMDALESLHHGNA